MNKNFRVLLIKTSSMGDIIHTLPALTDASEAIPNIIFDWVIEENFAEIPPWHQHVKQVIPIALRRWRKNIFSSATRNEWKQFRTQISRERYDLILDAQGLIKSGFLAFFAQGPRAGLDWHSARESLASLWYQQKYAVNFHQHAITRMRYLFAKSLGYTLPNTELNYGLNRQPFQTKNDSLSKEPYIIFLHGTTWATKLWPEVYWIQLAELLAKAGYRIKMSGGNPHEQERAKRIATKSSAVDVLPRQNITEMACLLANAKAAVAVDTGFGHLAAALEVPTVSIYGPTNPEFTGALGKFSTHLAASFPCAPCLSRTCTYRGPSAVKPACFGAITPERVFEIIEEWPS